MTFHVIKMSKWQCPNKVGFLTVNTASFPFVVDGNKPALILEKDHSHLITLVFLTNHSKLRKRGVCIIFKKVNFVVRQP